MLIDNHKYNHNHTYGCDDDCDNCRSRLCFYSPVAMRIILYVGLVLPSVAILILVFFVHIRPLIK